MQSMMLKLTELEVFVISYSSVVLGINGYKGTYSLGFMLFIVAF